MPSRKPRRKVTDITGQHFGRLVAIKCLGRSKSGHMYWHCVCECGTEKQIRYSNLVQNGTLSCGCLTAETARKLFSTRDGLSYSPEYHAWRAMWQRCYNPACKAYPNYGERGIRVCAQWDRPNGFAQFLLDMGPRPSKGHSLDRIDVNGNYEPSNCRWATWKEQRYNQRPRKCLDRFSTEELVKELNKRGYPLLKESESEQQDSTPD